MKILILFQKGIFFFRHLQRVLYILQIFTLRKLLNDYIIKMLFKILFTDLYDDKLYIRTCWIIVDHTLFVQVLWPKVILFAPPVSVFVKILSLAHFHLTRAVRG